MRTIFFLLLTHCGAEKQSRTNIFESHYTLVTSGRCSDVSNRWSLTSFSSGLKALQEMGNNRRVHYTKMEHGPEGTWQGKMYNYINTVGSGSCTSSRKCVCWVGPKCLETNGATMNPYSCKCGTSVCDRNSYCVSSMNHCSPVPIRACGGKTMSQNTVSCACGTSACSPGEYCHSTFDKCLKSSSAYLKKYIGHCSDTEHTYTVTNKENCIQGNIELHKGVWRTSMDYVQTFAVNKEAHGCLLRDHNELWLNTGGLSTGCSPAGTCICWSGPSCSQTNGLQKNDHRCRCGSSICAPGFYCDLNSESCFAHPICEIVNGTQANARDCMCDKRHCSLSTGLYCLSSTGTCSSEMMSACVSQNGTDKNYQACACGGTICPTEHYCDTRSSRGDGQCRAEQNWFFIQTTGLCTDYHNGHHLLNKDDCSKGRLALAHTNEVPLKGGYAPMGCYFSKYALYFNKHDYGPHLKCNSYMEQCICWQGPVCQNIDGTSPNDSDCMCVQTLCDQSSGLFCNVKGNGVCSTTTG